MKKRWFALLLAAGLLFAAAVPVAASEETAEEKKPAGLIYEETFTYENEVDHAKTLTTLGWEEQTKAMGAYTDPTAKISLADGRLAITGSKDTYFLMLTEEQMADYAGKTITIQYDVEYTTAGDASRYFCILANYAGLRYNSFHFRNNGTANNQVHYDSGWHTYDAPGTAADAYAAARDDGQGSSVAMKLLGQKYNGQTLFSGVPVTIRYVLDPSSGTSVYMKKAEAPESDFVLVSAHDPAGEGVSFYGSWSANAVCVKIGGQQNGYIDNIAVWLGNGDYPQPEAEEVEPQPEESVPEEPATETPEEETPAEEKPQKVKEPQTIVNKIAIGAVALFGGWIIVKKGKESESK